MKKEDRAEAVLSAGKNLVYHFLGYLQYFVALTIIVAIGITLLTIPQQLGLLTDVGSESLIDFLEYVINVIISIELIFVLLHQTLDSIVEVLSLAITRELILQHLHTYEFLLGVIAVAVLFAIRKFLFINKKDKPLSKVEDKTVTIDEAGTVTPSNPAAARSDDGTVSVSTGSPAAGGNADDATATDAAVTDVAAAAPTLSMPDQTRSMEPQEAAESRPADILRVLPRIEEEEPVLKGFESPKKPDLHKKPDPRKK